MIESETFNDNISEKIKIENLKTEIISSLESTISSLYQKELNALKDRCEKLMQNSYSNYIGQKENLRKEIENKDEIGNATCCNNRDDCSTLASLLKFQYFRWPIYNSVEHL